MAPSDSNSSSSSVSSNLDPNSDKPIFMYKIRSGAQVLSEKVLCKKLSSDPSFRSCRCSSIPIPRGASSVTVHNQDLWSDDEKSRYRNYPNSTSNLASVSLPRTVYWRRMLMGHFQNLYIVSPNHSPTNSENNSQDGSPNDSRQVSPANTFQTESATTSH